MFGGFFEFPHRLFAEGYPMLLSAFDVVARFGPDVFVDFVPCGFSDFTASGYGQKGELEGVEGWSVGFVR